jgi:UDP-glucose:(heptosyl)LPS alpha-1,3-glucosyltransferase
MKIGVVRRGFSATGGAERYLQRFAAAAEAAGHACILFTGKEWPAGEWHGEIVRVRDSSPMLFARALATGRVTRNCDTLFSLERVLECDVYRAGDGVHAAWLDRRATFESRWRSWFRRLRPKHRQLLALERGLFAGRRARAIIANSRMVRDEISSRFRRSADEIEVIYNGVPPFVPDPAARARVRESLGISLSAYVLLFVGSGWERKGLRFAVDAMHRAQVRDSFLLVAGSDRHRDAFVASDRVRLLEGSEKTSELLEAADVFVLPTSDDPFSNACLEAMAAGLPVITTRGNGFSEIIEAGVEGEVLADPRDTDALARCLEAWSPAARREAVRGKLRAKAAQFSVEANLRQTLAVILRGRPPR